MFLRNFDLLLRLARGRLEIGDFTQVSVNAPVRFHTLVSFGEFNKTLHLGCELAWHFEMPRFSSELCPIAQSVEGRYILAFKFCRLNLEGHFWE